MMAFEKILAVIESRGLKIGKTEQAAGIARNRISKLKGGQGELGWEDAVKLARVLGLPLDYLANDDQTEIPEPQPPTREAAKIQGIIEEIGEKEALRRLLAAQAPPLGGSNYTPPVDNRPGKPNSSSSQG